MSGEIVELQQSRSIGPSDQTIPLHKGKKGLNAHLLARQLHSFQQLTHYRSALNVSFKLTLHDCVHAPSAVTASPYKCSNETATIGTPRLAAERSASPPKMPSPPA